MKVLALLYALDNPIEYEVRRYLRRRYGFFRVGR